MNISRYIRNQQLIFNCVALLDILNIINGSDLNCWTHKIGFRSKKRNAQGTVQSTGHPQMTERVDSRVRWGEVGLSFSPLPMILVLFYEILSYNALSFQTWVVTHPWKMARNPRCGPLPNIPLGIWTTVNHFLGLDLPHKIWKSLLLRICVKLILLNYMHRFALISM